MKSKIILGAALLGVLMSGVTVSTTSCSAPQKEAKKYSVVFKNGNQVFSEVSVEEGKTVAKPENPTKDEDEDNTYTFDKWLNGTVAYDFTSPVTSDMTLIASYIATPIQKFEVKFMNESVQYGETVKVKKGNTVSAPKVNPTKASDAYKEYTFDKWLKDGIEYNFNTPVTSSITLNASYSETTRKYTVKFMNGSEEYKKDVLDAGSVVVAPETDPTAEKEGYTLTFLGWSTDGTIGGIVASFPTDLISNLTYVAVYNEVVNTYTATVHYNYEGGPEDESVEFTIENRDEKLEEVISLLPEEDEVYEYSFDEEITQLPLENVIYNIEKANKGFSYDFEDGELPNRLEFKDRSGAGYAEQYKVEDGHLEAYLKNDAIATVKNYKYFELSFDLMFQASSGQRINIILGLDDETIESTLFDACFNTVNKNAIMLVNSTKNAIRFYKDGVKSQETLADLSSAPGFDSVFVKYKIVVNQKGLSIFVNNNKIVANIEMTAELGKIGFYRADYEGTVKFDNMSLVATDGVPASNSFNTSFEDNVLPNDLIYNKKTTSGTGEGSYTISDNKFNGTFGYQVGTVDSLVTANKFKYFDLEVTLQLTDGGSDQRTNLCFGMPTMDGNPNHGYNATGECILLVSSSIGVRYYVNGSKSRVDKGIDLSAIASSYVTIKLSVKENKYTFAVGDGAPVELNTAFDNTEGHILFTTNSDRTSGCVHISNFKVTETDGK